MTSQGLAAEIYDLLSVPGLAMKRGAGPRMSRSVRDNLAARGWAMQPRVHPLYGLRINAIKDCVGFTIQTGNVSRAVYDLVKFQVMSAAGLISAAILAVPTSGAAKAIGSNVANFDRIVGELSLFRQVITVPCLVIGVDEGVNDNPCIGQV